MGTNLYVDNTPTEKLTKLMAVAQKKIELCYKGTTTTTDATELFVQGLDGYRIQPPLQSTGVVECRVLGYNVTDDTAAAAVTSYKTVAFFSRLSTTTAVTQVTDVTNVYNDAICTVTADDTNEYVKINVTAADTDTYLWKVFVDVYCQAEEDVVIDGEYDAVVK